MNKLEDWEEAVTEIFDEAGITATPEQIKTVSKNIIDVNDVYYESSGDSVSTRNWSADMQNKIEDLKQQLQTEKEKITCVACGGEGSIISHGPAHGSISTCYKCKGTGRI